MANGEVWWLTTTELGRLLRGRKLSPVEVTQDYLDRIAKLNPRLEAYVTVTADLALEAARRAEREIVSGQYRGPLHGVPYSLKDLFATKGVRTTAGSKILADNVPVEDAAVVALLEAAGSVLLGKVNTHEVAYGVTTQTFLGSTKNPWDLSRIPGGSSGGSASALAAGLCAFSLGSDTAGSIRCPASLCGVVGLKPTYGRVSCHGVFAQSWTADHVGPMARSVEDVAAVLQAIAGLDPRDPTTSREPVADYTAGLEAGVRGLRIGVPREIFDLPLDAGVASAFEAARRAFIDLGATVYDLSIPSLAGAQEVNGAIIRPEATSRHETWLRERPEEYGNDVRELLEAGNGTPASDYIRATVERQRIRFGVEGTLAERVDLLLTPCEPVGAPRIGEKTMLVDGKEVPLISGLVHFLSPFSLIGLPALSVPAGFDGCGLPTGIQLVGRAFDETTVLRAGHAFEQAAGWSRRHPLP